VKGYLSRKGIGFSLPLGLWIVLLLALVVIVAGCQPTGDEPASSPTQPASGGAEKELATVIDAQVPEGELYTVGFTPDGHAFKGNPKAEVIIEEFSSYQCPFCGRYFSETYPALTRQYIETGQVLYIFKDFPLSGQPQSPKAAEAARCAGDVGGAQAYWDMHDQLFGSQGEWSGRSNATEIFKDFAAQLGLDQAAFDECLDSGRTASEVQADSREGTTRGVRGTPSFFINGQSLVGAQPISAFASVIDAALAGETVAAAGDSQPAGSEATAAPELFVPTPAAFAFESGAEEGTLFALGDPDAPVTIVEFTDFQCPFCLRYEQETWPTLKERYVDTGRVYYVFKDFPLTSIHPQSFKAHEAARCAAALGGDDVFWQMYARLFEGQDEWAGNAESVAVFKGYAAELGLDQAAFGQCLDGDQQAAAVQATLDEGMGLGVNGTPTFFIAGYPFSGAQPIEFFDQAITLAENGQLREAIAQAIARAQEQQQQAEQPQPTIAPADVPIGDAPIKGDPDAPVTIVEYSDYQCPFCERHFQETLPQLLEDYVATGQARYVFKDFPLSQIHPQAAKAAEAARCAREQGGDEAYWQMHDRLFEGQADWSGNPDHVAVFKGYAAELGLDQATFDECLDGDRYAAAVQADLQEGAGFGVSGTPTFFINGQPLVGAQPYEVFVQVIEGLLAGQ
jgi:protein-disulfide isomerase